MTARVYVGTYAKYNNGSIAGTWLELENFSDRDDFLEACAKLHQDETDPELMFQDYEGFPRGFYGESHIAPELWDWLELSEDDREILAAYQDGVDSDADFAIAQERFCGIYDSEEDWAEQFLDDTGFFHNIPDTMKNYFDYQAYARDARLGGDMVFVRHNGSLYAFHNY